MRTRTLLPSLLAATLLQPTHAHYFAQHCPAPDLCYRLHIPPSAAATGKGDIFLQLDALVSYTWLGIGLGHSMAGARMMVVYADGEGGVTLSPRLEKGHYEPLYEDDADVELLEGSGVQGYKVTANIRCGDCNAWVGGGADFTADEGLWVFAAKPGLPLDSKDPEVQLQMHTLHGVFPFNYIDAKGVIPSSADPAQPIETLNITLQGVGAVAEAVAWKPTDAFPMAHGTVACLALLVLFPLGAVLIRVTAEERRLVWVHAGVQMGAYILLFAAMATGIYIASAGNLFHDKHPVIGIAIVIVLFFQAVDGLLHHAQWVRNRRRRTVLAHVHIWTGRVAIAVGMVNGGLGLMLAKVQSKGKLAGYGVVAGVSFVCLVVAVCYGEWKRKMELRRVKEERERKTAEGGEESRFE